MSSTPTAQFSPRYLSEDERIKIADLRRAGLGVREHRLPHGPQSGDDQPGVAAQPRPGNVPVSTVRGAPAGGAATRPAAAREDRPGPVLRRFVQDRLGRKWSPEQISHALPAEFPHHPERHVVPETIYQAVYRPDLGGLARDLPEKALRTGRRRRKPHRHPDSRRCR